MTHRMFHLGYFASFGPPAWHAASDQLHGSDWARGRHFADLAKKLEAAKFDLLFFEDTVTVSRALGGVMDTDLKYALNAPKHDPVALLSYLAASTERLGLVATASTSFYPPYLLARLLSTIDSLSDGRAGWNVVTSSENDAARNFGMDKLPPSGVRYDMADEFLDVVTQLWGSWDKDAVIADTSTGVYVDPAKVHEIAFRGQYHRSLGPLNTIPSPQGKPVIAQAGASPRGRDFAAKHAELVFATTAGGVPAMKALREDLHARLKTFGRTPEDCKLVFAAPVQFRDETGSGVATVTDTQFDIFLGYYSSFMDLDLSQYDPDKPIPESAEARGHTSFLDVLKDFGRQGKSLREGLVELHTGAGDLGLAGTPEDIADRLADAMDAVGGDGFMLLASQYGTEEYVRNVTERLVPRLQEIGAMRTEYAGATLRENLLAF